MSPVLNRSTPSKALPGRPMHSLTEVSMPRISHTVPAALTLAAALPVALVLLAALAK